MIKSLKDKEASALSKEEAINLIKSFIQKEEDLLRRKMISDDSFEAPAWSERQAFLLGGLKLADKILNYIPDQGK